MATLTAEQGQAIISEYVSSHGGSVSSCNDYGGSWGYQVYTGGNVVTVYVPKNYSSVDSISYTLTPGESTTYRITEEKIRNGAMPNTIYAVNTGNYDGIQGLELTDYVATRLGCTVQNAELISWSAGDYNAPVSLNSYAGRHPNTNLVYLDSQGINSDRWRSCDTSNLAGNSNFTVVYAGLNYGNEVADGDAKTMKAIYEQGINMLIVEPDETNHTAIYNDLQYDDYPAFLLGYEDGVGNTTGYHYYVYDPNVTDEKGRHFRAISYEEFRQLSQAQGGAYSTAVFNSLSLTGRDGNPISGDIIGSDLGLAMSSINNIRSAMSNNKAVVSPATLSFSSTTSFPAGVNQCHKSLFGISGDLLTALDIDTKLMVEVAQGFYDADMQMARVATNLVNGGDIFTISNRSSGSLSATTLVNVENNITFRTLMYNPTKTSGSTCGKLCLSDLQAIGTGGKTSSPLQDNFTSERDSAKGTKSTLGALSSNIGDHSALAGSAWESVSTRCDKYAGLMDLRSSASDSLDTATSSAARSLETFMTGYTELDDSELAELKSNRKEIEATVEEAREVLRLTETAYSNGVPYIRYVYSYESRTKALKYLLWAYTNLPVIIKHIEKLERLPIAVATAQQIMNNGLSEVYSSYGVKVADIVTGKTGSYTPPANTNYEAPPEAPSEVDTLFTLSQRSEADLRQSVVDEFLKYVGVREYTSGYRQIMDAFNNTHTKRDGYDLVMGWDTAWCAAAVTVAFADAGLLDVLPGGQGEYACQRITNAAKSEGMWRDARSGYVPQPGDIIMFKNGNVSSHVALVVSCENGQVQIVEGNNYQDACGTRTVNMSDYNVEGYVVPDYSRAASQYVLNADLEVPEGKVSQAEFDSNRALQNKYGNYSDYIAGVEKQNNPQFNSDLAGTGKTSTADFSIPDRDVILLGAREQTPESTTTPRSSYRQQYTPSYSTPVSTTPVQHATPVQQPTIPTTPTTPTKPTEPIEPTTPIEVTHPVEQPTEPTITEQPVEATETTSTPVEHTTTQPVKEPQVEPVVHQTSTPAPKPVAETITKPVPVEDASIPENTVVQDLNDDLTFENYGFIDEDPTISVMDSSNVVEITNDDTAMSPKRDTASKTLGAIAGLAAAAAAGYGVYELTKDKKEDKDDESDSDSEDFDLDE